MRLMFVFGRPSKLRPEEGPLQGGGGIKAALVELCTRLAQRGHDIDVFARCDQPGLHRGVRFHHRSELARFADANVPDALVVVPDGLPLLFPIRARARVIWTGNSFSSGDVALTARWSWAPHLGKHGRTARMYPLSLFASSLDLVVVKSRWQQTYVSERMHLAPDKFRVIFNGVDLHTFREGRQPGDSHRIVYTSQARRGLDRLIELFPRIKSAVPGAELHIFCYDGAPDRLVDRAATVPGVVWRGRHERQTLAGELRSAALMAYPATFKETFCTAVAEAQAAGLPVVCSSKAGVAERVQDGVDGFVIDGDPRGAEFGTRFVDSVVRLLQSDALRIQMGRASRAMAEERYNWDLIAGQWEAELSEATDGGEPRTPPAPAADLLDPSLLRVGDGEHSSQVPVEVAERWLRSAWASYGYDGNAEALAGLGKAFGRAWLTRLVASHLPRYRL